VDVGALMPPAGVEELDLDDVRGAVAVHELLVAEQGQRLQVHGPAELQRDAHRPEHAHLRALNGAEE
jgi:hypothetical protein